MIKERILKYELPFKFDDSSNFILDANHEMVCEINGHFEDLELNNQLGKTIAELLTEFWIKENNPKLRKRGIVIVGGPDGTGLLEKIINHSDHPIFVAPDMSKKILIEIQELKIPLELNPKNNSKKRKGKRGDIRTNNNKYF